MVARGPQGGAALAYVVGVLAIFGALTALVLRYTRFNDALVSRDRGDAQARLLAESGLDLALSRIDPPGPALDLAFTSEALEYLPENPDHTVKARVASRGLLARVSSTGRTALPKPGREKLRTALIGQALDLGTLPAVGLLNQEGNMVLAGTAQVTGPVLLWRGGVRKATDYHVRWSGGGGHQGSVWDSTAPAWKKLEPDFRRADAWVAAQEKLIDGGDPSDDPDYDSGDVADLPVEDSVSLEGKAYGATRIRARTVLRIGDGAVLMDCKLLAPRIVIEGDAVVENSVAFATRTLSIRGGAIKGGQFAARDSLVIEADQAFEGWPTFYVQGRATKARDGSDSTFVGWLEIRKAGGGGLFLSAARDLPVHDQGVRLFLGREASVEGLVYSGGFATVEGRLKGSLLCKNLRFEYKGTIWLGHLKDARISAYTGPKDIPAPLLFPGYPLASFPGAGP